MPPPGPITGGGVSKAYVDAGDANAIATAEAYSDAQLIANLNVGTYMPTFTDLSATPLNSITAGTDFTFHGAGSVITISGAIDVKFSTILSTQLVQIEISLPGFLSPSWTDEGMCAGTAVGLDNTGLAVFSGFIKANIFDQVAELDFPQLLAYGTSTLRMFLHFTLRP